MHKIMHTYHEVRLTVYDTRDLEESLEMNLVNT